MSVELFKAARDRKPIVIGRHNLLFGIPDQMPAIDGCEVVARKDHWLMARRKLQMWFVGDHGGRWTLYPAKHRKKFRCRSNPRGEWMDCEHPVHIVKRAA